MNTKQYAYYRLDIPRPEFMDINRVLSPRQWAYMEITDYRKTPSEAPPMGWVFRVPVDAEAVGTFYRIVRMVTLKTPVFLGFAAPRSDSDKGDWEKDLDQFYAATQWNHKTPGARIFKKLVITRNPNKVTWRPLMRIWQRLRQERVWTSITWQGEPFNPAYDVPGIAELLRLNGVLTLMIASESKEMVDEIEQILSQLTIWPKWRFADTTVCTEECPHCLDYFTPEELPAHEEACPVKLPGQ